jgi:Holliday junction resolvase RusA-like endonuclease
VRDTLTFFVDGDPTPQGSKSATWNQRAQRIVVLEGRTAGQRQKFHNWRDHVASCAFLALHDAGRRTPYRGPLAVELLFVHVRAKSTPAEHRWRSKRPDIDKTTRAVLDGLTQGAAIGDDAQVAELIARKVLARPGEPIGVHISIRTLDHAEAP